MNTRVLFVENGDSDYAATNYEDALKDGKIEPMELWEQSWVKQEKQSYSDDLYTFDYKALKFGDIDPAFIEFVQEELHDYDVSKQHNFYII